MQTITLRSEALTRQHQASHATPIPVFVPEGYLAKPLHTAQVFLPCISLQVPEVKP